VLLRGVMKSSMPEDEAARDLDALHTVLKEIHDSGYALRNPQVWPATNTLAVPLFDSHGVAASLGMTFFSSTMKPEQAVERYLPDLQDVANQVSARLTTLQAG
jgi:IclR family mhp operon transcriptional activator